jgi:hypothetical protein
MTVQAAVEKGRHGVGKKSFAAIGAVVLALTAVGAPLVQAEGEDPRVEYKEAVEPICKVNTKTNERLLKGVTKLVKNGKLKVAAQRFFRASTALRKTLAELKAVPRPSADEAKLNKWLKTIGVEVSLFQKTGKKLKEGDKNGALAMRIRLEHNANVANNQVLGFEFHYCRFDTSKFT